MHSLEHVESCICLPKASRCEVVEQTQYLRPPGLLGAYALHTIDELTEVLLASAERMDKPFFSRFMAFSMRSYLHVKQARKRDVTRNPAGFARQLAR